MRSFFPVCCEHCGMPKRREAETLGLVVGEIDRFVLALMRQRRDNRLALYQNRDKAGGRTRSARRHQQKNSRWCRHHSAQQRCAGAAVSDHNRCTSSDDTTATAVTRTVAAWSDQRRAPAGTESSVRQGRQVAVAELFKIGLLG